MKKGICVNAEANVISRLVSIENVIPVLESRRQAVAASEKELKQMIDEYQQARFALFLNRMKQEKKQGWCTIGHHFMPVSGLKFIFLTGKRWHKSHESDYLRDYAELHRACPACRRKELEMSGSGDGSAVRFAFSVKKESGKKFLYKKHGAWLAVPAEAEIQETPNSALTKELAAELGLPKMVDYSCCPFRIIINA